MRWLRTGLKIIALAALTLVGLVALIFAGLQTDRGKDWLVATINHAMAGEARVGRLSGGVPWDMTVAEIELQDPSGAWARVEEAALKFAPADLLRGRLTIALLGARNVRLERRPQQPTSEKPQAKSGGSTRLPIAVELRRLDVRSIELAPPVLGTAVQLSLTGDATIDGGESNAHLALRRIDGDPGRLDAAFALSSEPARLTVALDMAEPGGKLLDALLSRDDHLPLAIAVHGDGPLADWRGRIEAHAGDRGRLATDITLSGGDGERVIVDGELLAAPLLPPAIAELIGDKVGFHLAGGETPDGALRADEVVLHAAAAEIAASGRMSPGTEGAVAAKLRLAVDDLGRLSPLLGRPASGSATLDVAASGTRTRPSITATLTGHGLRLADKGADTIAARLTATTTAPLDDPGAGIAFDGDGRVGSIIVGDSPRLDQEIAWRLAGSASRDGRALELHDMVVDGPGVTLTASATADREKQAASAVLHLAAADLSRLAGLVGRDLAGNGAIDAALSAEPSGAAQIHIGGGVHDLATGIPAADGLLGRRLTIDLSGSRAANGDLGLADATIDAANLHFSAKGRMDSAGDRADGSFALDLPHLDALATEGHPAAGRARLEGTLSGGARAPRLDATLDAADVRFGEARLDRLAARLHATRDAAPAGALDAEFQSGDLAGTLTGRAALSADGKTLDLAMLRLDAGATTLDAALRTALDTHLTSGTLEARSRDLSQLSSLVGMPLSGKLSLDARLATERGQSATFSLAGTKLGASPNSATQNTVERITAKGRFSDLLGNVSGNGDLTILGAKLGGASLEQLHASLKSRRAGSLAFTADMRGELKAPLALATAGDIAMAPNKLAGRIVKFAGTLGDQSLRLARPLRFDKSGEDVSFSDLSLALGPGQIDAAASLKRNAVMAKLAARDVPLSLAEAFLGKGAVDGSVNADVDLRGAVERPVGRVALGVRELRVAAAKRPELPSFDITAEAQLQPGRIGVTGRLAGPKGEAIDLAGALPIKVSRRPLGATVPRNGALSLRIEGDGRLETLADILPIGEDRLAGHYHLDLSATGTLASPSASGQLTLDHGRYESLTLGTVLDAMTLDLAGEQDRIVLRQFTANDGGKGSLRIGGTVALGAKPAPAFDAAMSLNTFQLVHRDDAVAHGSGDIHVLGTLAEPRVIARLKVDDAELFLSERLPPSVRQLDVSEIDSTTGQVLREPAPPSSKPPIVAALDVKLDVPGQVFVRGRGLDSEWKGQFAVGGTSAAPDIQGSLEVVHGTMNFLGKTLDLTRGTVTLAGGNKVEPLLDFLAQSNQARIRAQVEVTGPAENPKIKLTSDPPLPQDQVLAQLLFGRDVTQLTPLEGLQIAQAAATLASGGPGVIDRVRMKFGLDRLSVGSSDSSTSSKTASGSSTPSGAGSGAAGAAGNTSVSAGKYVAEGVYVGVDQGVSGDSRAKVEVEINRNVTVDTTTSTTRGNSVGLNWKLDY